MLRLSVGPRLDCDVLIAGGGPAGATAAAYLAQAGLKVMLVDRQRFPRDKVCGDFVGPAALIELRSLGITELDAYRRSNVIHEAALYLDGRHLITHGIPQIDDMPAHGRVIRRIELDEWILNAARSRGAQVVEGCRVQGFEVDAGGVRVELKDGGAVRSVRARLLIGADGSGSLVARRLRGGTSADADRIIAVRGYFEGIAGPADRADLYFSGNSFPGYYWLFPTGAASANVGIGMVLDTLPATDEHLRDLLLGLIERDPALRQRLGEARLVSSIGGWPLATYNASQPVVAERVLLTGDAAGLINPLNGEGIQYAMLSARWAAETVVACLASADFSAAALASYARRVERELRYDMALSRLIVQLIRNRSLNPVWLQALRIIVARARGDAAYAQITGGVLAGLVPASRVVSVDIVRKTVMQAALSLGVGTAKSLFQGSLKSVGWAAGRAAVDTAATMARHPTQSLGWGAGVAASAVELGAEVARNVVAPARKVARDGDARMRWVVR